MAKKSTLCKIDGVAMPDPTAITVALEDLEASAERDATGRLHRERVRQGVRKVSFTYDVLAAEDYAALLALLAPAFFSLTYPDPTGERTIEAYCAKKDGALVSGTLYGGCWRGVKMNCIER